MGNHLSYNDNMAFLILFAFAVGTAFILHWLKGWWWLSLSLPAVGFVSFLLHDAYIAPYRGGGASMWPIAVLFGMPVILLGSVCGVAAARLAKTWRNTKSQDT